MRVTTDTNVLLSSSFWLGTSFTILEKVKQNELELILSEKIINELRRVLQYEDVQKKIRDKNLQMKRTVEEIISMATIVDPKEKLDRVRDDPDDNKILECAIEGNSEYLITNNNHLLKIKEFRGIKIIKPEEFLEIFNKSN
jgi:putative PIN family toxin of toxin-antitoxin system